MRVQRRDIGRAPAIARVKVDVSTKHFCGVALSLTRLVGHWHASCAALLSLSFAAMLYLPCRRASDQASVSGVVLDPSLVFSLDQTAAVCVGIGWKKAGSIIRPRRPELQCLLCNQVHDRSVDCLLVPASRIFTSSRSLCAIGLVAISTHCVRAKRAQPPAHHSLSLVRQAAGILS